MKEKITQIEMLPENGLFGSYKTGFLAITSEGNIYFFDSRKQRWEKFDLPIGLTSLPERG